MKEDKLKSMKLSDAELVFLKEYRRMEDFEREKGIKFFECIGDPPATSEYKTGVIVKRQNFVQENLQKMREVDVTRFSTEINKDLVIVPTDIDV
jgi:hypothetical protein